MEDTLRMEHPQAAASEMPEKDIVVEVERVETTRKRATTEVRHCSGCGALAYVVSHAEAAELFETAPSKLIDFLKLSDCHYEIGWNGKIWLCVISLLATLRKQDKPGIKLLPTYLANGS